MIEVPVTLILDGTKRPLCKNCMHSIFSHGERGGVLFCWACHVTGKTCGPKQVAQTSICVQ
jgi:hypothetical protein